MAAPPPKHSWVRGALSGATMGSYLLERLLGEGGMGEVYSARQRKTGRRVAVKVLIEARVQGLSLRERFEREWRVLQHIVHPNVVALLDWPETRDGPMFFAMELLEGEPLSSLLEREERLPIDQVIDLATQLARGLSAVHDAGIVHRDVKPQNVFLCTTPPAGAPSSGLHVKLLDFGLARVVGSQITGSGLIVGTPAYVAPEQASGDLVDLRTDVYALGLVLYRSITGQHPFSSEDQVATLGHQLLSPPPPLSWLREDVPPSLEALVLRMLRKRPEDRPASMDEVLSSLLEAERRTIPPGSGFIVDGPSDERLSNPPDDRYGPLNPLTESLVKNALVAKGFRSKG
ncbi:MAG: serine/threonine-protein kinase [Polyangiaceae bacterium]